MSMAEVRETMTEAIKAWSVIAFGRSIKFKELTSLDNQPSFIRGFFNISFVSIKDDDRIFPLFMLPLNKYDTGYWIKYGNIYFNKNKKWKKYRVGEKVEENSLDFYSVAMYTIGQWIGFKPSENKTSIMYDEYRNPVDEFGNYVKPIFSEYDWKQSYSNRWNPDDELSESAYYTIINDPTTLSLLDVQETMVKAFNTWTLLYPYWKFFEIPLANFDCKIHCYGSSRVYNISFESGKHNDSYYADSTFNDKQAGHAMKFNFIHFNKDIQWRKYKAGEKVDNKSTDFYSIALYTVGELMGWRSSKNETSIMYEGYQDSIDENGNYIEPMFSEYDLEYFDKFTLMTLAMVRTEEEINERSKGLKTISVIV